MQHGSTYFKDLKPSDVQDSYEVLARQGGVQGPVDPSNEPFEHAVIRGFGQSTNGVGNLPHPRTNPHTHTQTQEEYNCHSHG